MPGQPVIVTSWVFQYNSGNHEIMKYLAFAPLCALLFLTACSQSPEKLVAAGNRYHKNKKYNEASILYQKAITKDKTNGEAYYRQGLNLLDMHDPVSAARYLRRAVDLQPNNADAETKLAEIYLTAYVTNPTRFKSLYAEIGDLDQKILQHQPDSFNGLRLQGLLFLTQNQRDKALESFAKANQVKPHSPDLVWWYGEALVAAGRAQEGEALVRDTLNADPTWGRGYDFLFILYTRENQKDKAEAVLREHVQKNPTSVPAIENLASYLVNTSRYAEAEAVMRRVLADPKDFPGGHELLGDFYFRAKKYDQALQQFQAGLKDDPKHDVAYNERVVAVYQKTGRTNDALQLARSVNQKNPKDATASEIYAGLLLETGTAGNISKSTTELKTLVQNSPNDGALHLDLARVYFATKQMDKSLSEASDALQYESKSQAPRPAVLSTSRIIMARIYEDRGQHAKALEQTSVLLQTDPKNPDVRLLQDRALIGSNQIAKGQADLESVLQEFPNFPEAKEARLQVGNLYLFQKQYDKASAEFEQVWKANPPDVRGYIALQTVKMAQGKTQEAISAMQDLVQKNPGDLNLRFQLAAFQTNAGMQVGRTDPAGAKVLFEQAADNYKEILKTSTNSAEVWLRLGVLQRQLNQYDSALASFEQAANTDPHNASAVLNQAILLQALGKRKEALASYNKALGIDPENALALNNLAFMNAENGTNLDQAMTFAERAKKKVPNNADISDTLGYVYFQKNLNAEALQIFRQDVQNNPRNAMFHLHLAMALEKQGNRQGARDEAQKALKNASQPDEQNRIRSFLNQLG